jgi:hypothetical protein
MHTANPKKYNRLLSEQGVHMTFTFTLVLWFCHPQNLRWEKAFLSRNKTVEFALESRPPPKGVKQLMHVFFSPLFFLSSGD